MNIESVQPTISAISLNAELVGVSLYPKVVQGFVPDPSNLSATAWLWGDSGFMQFGDGSYITYA